MSYFILIVKVSEFWLREIITTNHLNQETIKHFYKKSNIIISRASSGEIVTDINNNNIPVIQNKFKY